MKRTLPDVIDAALFQSNKTADNFYDVDAGENLLYRLLADQDNRKRGKIIELIEYHGNILCTFQCGALMRLY